MHVEIAQLQADTARSRSKAMVEAMRAQYHLPTQTIMRWLTVIIVLLLTFMGLIVFACKALGVDTTLGVVVIIVAGATIAAPLGILLTKIVARLLPGQSSSPPKDDDKTE